MARSDASLIAPVLVAGRIILVTGFAIRASFGLFQIPIAAEFGRGRADFSLAIAIQNLAWGIGTPIFRALAEQLGDRRAIVIGALLCAACRVAHAWSIRLLGTLHGIVFLSNQIGGFRGVRRGGRLHGATGDYVLVWWIGASVGAFPALVHFPVREGRDAAVPAPA